MIAKQTLQGRLNAKDNMGQSCDSRARHQRLENRMELKRCDQYPHTNLISTSRFQLSNSIKHLTNPKFDHKPDNHKPVRKEQNAHNSYVAHLPLQLPYTHHVLKNYVSRYYVYKLHVISKQFSSLLRRIQDLERRNNIKDNAHRFKRMYPIPR